MFAKTTDIESGTELPTHFSLEQNYPNPFNPETTIRYTIPKSSQVTLKVYDVLGREVATLVDEFNQAGEHQATFKVETPYMASLPSGVYFYRLAMPTSSITKKMLLIK